jgi:hypothetical protein
MASERCWEVGTLYLWHTQEARALLRDHHPVHFSGFTLLGVGMTSDNSAITCIPLDELHRWRVMARIESIVDAAESIFGMWFRGRPAAADFCQSRTDPTRETPPARARTGRGPKPGADSLTLGLHPSSLT